jgi:hypothetical protein
MKQDVMSCSAKAPMCPCYKALAEKKGAESFESPILYDEDGDEVDFDDDDYENSGWEKTYDADWTMLDEMGLYGKTSGCVGCQMQKPVSEKERVAIQKQVNKFNEQLALDPDDDFERYILLDLDDENLIEDAFFSRQTWKPLTEAFRKRWGERSELMDKISIAQVGEKSNWSIYSFEKPFWFEYETDPQDTATAEDPEGYGLGFEFDMTKEEAIEKARQIHKETKGAITMYNTARKRSGGGSTRIHPKFWATPEMMEEQKDYYKREGMKWPTGDDLVPYNFNAESESDRLHSWATNMRLGVRDLVEDIKRGAVYDLDDCRERLEKIRDDTSHLNAEYHRDSKGRFAEKPLLTGSVIGGLALGLMYFMGRK